MKQNNGRSGMPSSSNSSGKKMKVAGSNCESNSNDIQFGANILNNASSCMFPDRFSPPNNAMIAPYSPPNFVNRLYQPQREYIAKLYMIVVLFLIFFEIQSSSLLQRSICWLFNNIYATNWFLQIVLMEMMGTTSIHIFIPFHPVWGFALRMKSWLCITWWKRSGMSHCQRTVFMRSIFTITILKPLLVSILLPCVYYNI